MCFIHKGNHNLRAASVGLRVSRVSSLFSLCLFLVVLPHLKGTELATAAPSHALCLTSVC